MTDQEINEKLARILGYKVELVNNTVIARSEVSTNVFDYHHPAIFAENVIWLLGNGCAFYGSTPLRILNSISLELLAEDKDPYKAVALARIEAAIEDD